MNKDKSIGNHKLDDKGVREGETIKKNSTILAEQEKALTIQQAIDLALQHHQESDLPKAESIYQQILQADPNQPDALHLLGVIAHQVGKNDIAVDLIMKALSIKPDHADAHSNLGNALQELGRFDEAARSYNKALSIKPDYADAHSNLGNVLTELGKPDKAVSSYNKAIAIKPDYAEAHFNLGNTLRGLGRLDETVSSYNKAIVIKPDYAEAYFNLGNTLQELGELDEAVASFNKSIAIKPDIAEMYSNLGYTFQVLGKLDKAVRNYNKALTIKPYYADAHCNLGNLLKELGNPNEAVSNYNKAIAIKPDYAEAHNNLGIALKEIGQLDDAVISYRKAIAIDPDYPEAYNNLGNALQELGKLDGVVASYNKAITINPNFAEAHSNLGLALHALGRLSEALASYSNALAIKPDYAEVHFNLGVCLHGSRQYKKAAEQFKLTNFGKSKSYLLKCLYEQDDNSLFYDQLDYLISQGEINPIIGSLSSRSEIKYGTSRPNPFCKDPLKYVLKTDLTEQYDFKTIFAQTAKNILNGDIVSYMSQSLLVNGHQTAGNLLLLKGDFIDEIKRILESEIDKYRLSFKNSEEGFIKNWPTNYSLSGWLISMKSGGELSPHMHENGWISGSVYINVPPKIEKDSGNLVVCIDDEEDSGSGSISQKRSIDVVTGSLCLFPASLLHYTIPFESEEQRIVLAFDVVPT